jgi:crossover junction endodeoxyribonuclease RuvC
MIGKLTGLVDSLGEDWAIIDVHGVGYIVFASSRTLGALPARGVALLSPAMRGIAVGEYLPMIVKKSVVGNGHADKLQVAAMVERLLPGCEIASADAADALAVAICHSHHLATARRWDPAVARNATV